MDAEFFTTILRKGLIKAANDGMGDSWTSQQNKVPVLSSEQTLNRLSDNEVHVLDWPARFSDPNIIGSACKLVFRELYKHIKSFKTTWSWKKLLSMLS